MANNRIFIVNTITKKYLCLGRHLGGPWCVSSRSNELEAFFDDSDNAESFWEDENCYELMYENDEEFQKMKGENFNLK